MADGNKFRKSPAEGEAASEEKPSSRDSSGPETVEIPGAGEVPVTAAEETVHREEDEAPPEEDGAVQPELSGEEIVRQKMLDKIQEIMDKAREIHGRQPQEIELLRNFAHVMGDGYQLVCTVKVAVRRV